jgi:hypothetical protein
MLWRGVVAAACVSVVRERAVVSSGHSTCMTVP